MSSHTTYYRTKDGRADYHFSFEEQYDGSWRAYILEQPSYGYRSTGAHPTHRHTDDDGRHYICWDSSLDSLDEAMHVAALWANCTQDYIRYGTDF